MVMLMEMMSQFVSEGHARFVRWYLKMNQKGSKSQREKSFETSSLGVIVVKKPVFSETFFGAIELEEDRFLKDLWSQSKQPIF